MRRKNTKIGINIFLYDVRDFAPVYLSTRPDRCRRSHKGQCRGAASEPSWRTSRCCLFIILNMDDELYNDKQQVKKIIPINWIHCENGGMYDYIG